MFYAIYMATRPRGFALVLVPVYFYIQRSNTVVVNKTTMQEMIEVSDKINGHRIIITRFLVEFILKLNRSMLISYVYPETDTNYVDTKIHCIII